MAEIFNGRYTARTDKPLVLFSDRLAAEQALGGA
jgi:hypothetical protein